MRTTVVVYFYLQAARSCFFIFLLLFSSFFFLFYCYYFNLFLVVRCKIAEVRGSPPSRNSASRTVGTPSGRSEELQRREMYGASGIPELIPPAGPPRQPGPAGQFNPGHPQVGGHGGPANPQRLGQRAPKLGQIGRSKKVDLEDEDLDDIMNNNGQCAVSLSPIS